jgi:hypothetical protein
MAASKKRTTKKNVTVSGKGTRSSNGLWNKITGLPLAARALLVILLVFALTGIGTAGYFKYKEQELKAQAANWFALPEYDKNYVQPYACILLRTQKYSYYHVLFVKNTRDLPRTYLHSLDRDKRRTGSASQWAWYYSVSAMKGVALSDGYIETNYSKPWSVARTPDC